MYLYVVNMDKRIGLNFAELSWHVQNCDLIGPSKVEVKQTIHYLQDIHYEPINQIWDDRLLLKPG